MGTGISNHRAIRYAVAAVAGLAVAVWAYQWITDPLPRQQRAEEIAVVLHARQLLRDYVAAGGELRVVDPVDTDRKVGKVYIYPDAGGWQLSGHYRRAGETRWHAWLMTLDRDRALVALDVQDDDPQLQARAAGDPAFSVRPPAALQPR